MATLPIESVFHLGFRFEPTPQEVVTYYLPRLVADEPMHAAIRGFIHRADVYACEPGVLAAHFRPTPKGDRFFFTTCKLQKEGKSSRALRAAGPGSWHSQGNGTDVVVDDGVKIGELKKLRYKKDGEFTDWLMDEFSSCSSAHEGYVVGDRQHVVCKIYVSPRALPDSVARWESTAFFAPPQEPVVAAAPKKRLAAPPAAAEPPSSKRSRGAVVSNLPAVQPPCVRPPPPSTTTHPGPAIVPVRPVQAPPSAKPPSNNRIRGAVFSTLPAVQPPCVRPPPPSTTRHPAGPVIVPVRPVQAPPAAEPLSNTRIRGAIFSTPSAVQPPCVRPPPSTTRHPAGPVIVPVRPVQAPTPPPQVDPFAQTTVSPQAARSPVATESPAARDNDDVDLELVKLIESSLGTDDEAEKETAEVTTTESSPAASAQDDEDDDDENDDEEAKLEFAQLIESAFKDADKAEEADEAEDDADEAEDTDDE